MWRTNWPGLLEISWTKFVPVFYKAINEPLARDREKDTGYKCLHHLLIADNTGHRDGEQEDVTLERFGLLVKWFGVLNNDQGNILKRLQATAQNPWFHGDIQKLDCESLLASFAKEHGTFLVRLSTTEPVEKTPFTISKVARDGAVLHQRIGARSDGRGFYISQTSKAKGKTNEKIEAPGLVDKLIEKVTKDLHLKKPCPGSRYRDIFHTNKVDGYLPTPDDDDDDED